MMRRLSWHNWRVTGVLGSSSSLNFSQIITGSAKLLFYYYYYYSSLLKSHPNLAGPTKLGAELTSRIFKVWLDEYPNQFFFKKKKKKTLPELNFESVNQQIRSGKVSQVDNSHCRFSIKNKGHFFIKMMWTIHIVGKMIVACRNDTIQ